MSKQGMADRSAAREAIKPLTDAVLAGATLPEAFKVLKAMPKYQRQNGDANALLYLLAARDRGYVKGSEQYQADEDPEGFKTIFESYAVGLFEDNFRAH